MRQSFTWDVCYEENPGSFTTRHSKMVVAPTFESAYNLAVKVLPHNAGLVGLRQLSEVTVAL